VDPGRRRWLVPAVAGFGVVVGAVGVSLKVADGSHPSVDTALSAVSGFLFLAAGLAAHLRRPANGTGLLMVLVGVAFFAEDLQLARSPWLFSLGVLLANASAPFVVHLVLAFPYGRLTSRPVRLLTAATYAIVAFFAVIGALFVDWPAHYPGKPDNLLLITDSYPIAAVAGISFEVIGAAIAVGVVALLAYRLATARRGLRAPFAPTLVIAVVTAVASAVGSAVGPHSGWHQVLLDVYHIGFCLWPLAFLLGALLAPPYPDTIADLLVAAPRPATAAELRDLLAEALRDPTLRLGQWQPDAAAFVDTAGGRLEPGADADGMLLRPADGTGRPVGVLLHNGSPWADARLTNAVAALAGLVLENQRLTAEVSAQLAEVHASRARLVSLTDDERRRVERDLHDGAQQRLVTVALGLRLARRQLGPDGDPEVAALLSATAEGVDAAMVELRELARGIHPALLTEEGLVAALTDLADRAPLPVTLTAPLVPRLPAAVEATVYFVVSEALTNALKHASADRVDVRLQLTGQRLRVDVVDDGVGGASITTASGLHGLRDRVRALGGELHVQSEPGAGTTVVAELPDRVGP
jgi:signal transduction histidine kinase